MSSDDATEIPAWLNASFAKRLLKKSNSFDEFSIVSLEVNRATAKGDNYLSDVYRMSLELESNAKQCRKTTSFIIKCLPEGEIMQKMAQEMKAFQQETRIFIETIPMMSQLLRNAAPGKFTQLSALCFSSGSDPLDYLVLEDLKASGFTLAERRSGLNLAHARLVVRKLAQFHAASIGICEENSGALDNYMTMWVFEGGSAPMMEKFFSQSCLLLADVLETTEDVCAKYAPNVRTLSENMFAKLMKLTKQDRKFRVLAHADTWVNNLMFKYSNGVVKDVVLLDFQVSTYLSPSVDLQYFLHTSLSEDVFLNHSEDLLKEYHSHLTEIMSDIGIDTAKQISYEELYQDYEDHALYGLFAAVSVLPIVLSNEKTGFDVEASLEGTDAATNRNSYANPAYLNVIKMMLSDFEKKRLL